MAYLACVRARLVRHEHARDNVIEGELTIGDETYSYQSRGHIAKAVNRFYRSVNWKPREGDEVIIDGDLANGLFTIDHIEPWRPDAFTPLGRHEDLIERLPQAIAEMPELNKILRHRLDENGVRFVRWADQIDGKMGRRDMPSLVSAIIDADGIRFSALTREMGRTIPLEGASILPLIAKALGIPHAEMPRKSKTEPRLKIGRKPPPRSSTRKTLASSDPNKWVPGVPYRPVGMPEPEVETLPPPYSDCPF